MASARDSILATPSRIKSPTSPTRSSMGGGGGLSTPIPQDTVAVNVAVRIRPPLDPDDPNGEIVPSRFKNGIVEAPTANTVTITTTTSAKKRFLFDRAFEWSTDQVGVWNYVSSSVNSLIQGYNVSIMAYGQSGSGKSYTMGTSDEDIDDSQLGIIPRASKALFEQLENPQQQQQNSGEMSPTKSIRPPSLNISPKNILGAFDSKPWTVSVSYLEIYNEQLRDLLLSNANSKSNSKNNNLHIREDVKGNISVKGLTEVVVESSKELLKMLEQGSAARQTNSTAVNSQSSRSHAIFTIHLTQKQLNPETGIITTVTSKLNLVDLAGSERLKNTGTANEGRVKEGISINSGLTSLGKVISQLSSRPGAHISYRDSKLTRILQDSLGGKAITHLIACVTPEAFYASESLNTLTYAQRARAIQLAPEIQQGETSKEDLLQVVSQLRQEVQFWKAKTLSSGNSSNGEIPSPLVLGEATTTASAPSTPSMTGVNSNNNIPYTPVSETSADYYYPGSAETTKERVSRSTAFHSAVESIINDYEQTIQSLQESVAVSRSSLFELSDTLHEKEDLLENAQNANVELSELIEQLQQTIVSMKTQDGQEPLVGDLEKQIVELKTELSSYRNEHKRHLSESQYLTLRYNNSRREVETLTQEKEQLEYKLRKLEMKGAVLDAQGEESENSSISSTTKGIRELETPTKSRQSSSSSNKGDRGRRKSSFFVQASVT